jgi:hypothetical protein
MKKKGGGEREGKCREKLEKNTFLEKFTPLSEFMNVLA